MESKFIGQATESLSWNPFRPAESHEGEKISKNCQRPKRVGRVRMCNLQSAKNCASAETSQATVHARAQEMKKTDRQTSAPILYFPTRAHRPAFGCVWSLSSDRASLSGFLVIKR